MPENFYGWALILSALNKLASSARDGGGGCSKLTVAKSGVRCAAPLDMLSNIGAIVILGRMSFEKIAIHVKWFICFFCIATNLLKFRISMENVSWYHSTKV